MRTTPRRTASVATSVLVVCLILALWWFFAPTTLGGSFAYVVVNGDSMSPRLKTDDIVLLRNHRGYEVGDAVAYRHPQLGTVFHRIVATEGERFVLRGDNRSGDDSYQPLPADIIGAEWAMLPGGGRVVRELQEPRSIALLFGAAALLLAGGSASRDRVRRAGARAWTRTPRPGLGLSIYSQAGRQLIAAAAVVALGSGALLVLFVSRGVTAEEHETLAFAEQGAFSYGGALASGVYDGDTLEAPEPLYRLLSEELPVRFAYQLQPGTPDRRFENVIGSYQLLAEVSTEDGWKRTFPLADPAPFADAGFEAVATIDLADIDRELAAVAELTGVAAGGHVLRVVARVEAGGQLEGVPFETTYQHFVQFRMSELTLRFDSTPDTLRWTQPGSVARPTTVPRTLDAKILPLEVGYARFPLIAGLGLLAAAGLGLLVAAATWRANQRGEAARIHAAYGALLVEVARELATFARRPHEVSAFDDLVRLAAAEGLAVMHHAGDQLDEYLVATNDRSWRYTVPRRPAPRLAPPRRLITTGES